MARVMSLESSRFRCCCGCCHVKVGCAILAVIEIILIALYVASEGVKLGVLSDQVYQRALPSVIVSAILFVLLVIAVILMVIGLCMEKAWLLIPHLIVQALYIIALVVAFILAIVFLVIAAVNKDNPNQSYAQNPLVTDRDRQNFANLQNTLGQNNVNPDYAYLITGIIVIVYFFLLFCLEMWFFSIVYRCYQYFKLKAAVKKAAKANPPPGSHAEYNAQTAATARAAVHPTPAYYGGQHFHDAKPRHYKY